MCLIVLAIHQHSQRPLLVAANRDEFYRRPSAAAEFWPEDRHILGGRDLQGQGTWLAVSRSGRWAAVTNVRNPRDMQPGRRSRGWLVRDYLLGNENPAEYLGALQREAEAYPGFNLLVGDGPAVWYFSSRGAADPQRLQPGIYGLSNALLNTPWPKVQSARTALADLLRAADPPAAPELFALLADEQCAADAELPSTGVSLEWERTLSPRFIRSADYGTRCSTVFSLLPSGALEFRERSFSANPLDWQERGFFLRGRS